MKQKAKNNLISLILVFSLVIIAGWIVLKQPTTYSNVCVDNDNTFKEGLQKINCNISTRLYEKHIINNKCYINCSKEIDALANI